MTQRTAGQMSMRRTCVGGLAALIRTAWLCLIVEWARLWVEALGGGEMSAVRANAESPQMEPARGAREMSAVAENTEPPQKKPALVFIHISPDPRRATWLPVQLRRLQPPCTITQFPRPLITGKRVQ